MNLMFCEAGRSVLVSLCIERLTAISTSSSYSSLNFGLPAIQIQVLLLQKVKVAFFLNDEKM